jgi:hypothetical protein
VSGHRTNCGAVHNATGVLFSVEGPALGLEGARTKLIAVGKTNTFDCWELFWECENTDRVHQRALRFRRSNTAAGDTDIDEFYMFMQKSTMNIMWTPMMGASYETSVQVFPGANRAGCLDVRIRMDPASGAASGTPPRFFPTVTRIW